jgi:hypothetical protein
VPCKTRGQALFALGQRLFRLLERGDVGMRDGHAVSGIRPQRHDGHRKPALSLWCVARVFEAEAGQGPVQNGLDPLAGVDSAMVRCGIGIGRANGEIVGADVGILRWLAGLDAIFEGEEPPAFVGRPNDAVAIQYHDFGRHRIQDDVLEGFAFPEDIFRMLALGDVHDVADDLDDPVAAAQRLGGRAHPLRGAGGAAEGDFDIVGFALFRAAPEGSQEGVPVLRPVARQALLDEPGRSGGVQSAVMPCRRYVSAVQVIVCCSISHSQPPVLLSRWVRFSSASLCRKASSAGFRLASTSSPFSEWAQKPGGASSWRST